MRRLFLAFSCFFRVLLGRPLPAALLPAQFPVLKPEPPRAPEPSATDRLLPGATALLALLQREGRLVDFLEEPIGDYDDARVGAAVRAVHKGCKKALDEHLSLAHVHEGAAEGERVTIEPGFDAREIRLVGAVHGDPPFSGVLRHPGWRVARVELDGLEDARIVAPAEVEL